MCRFLEINDHALSWLKLMAKIGGSDTSGLIALFDRCNEAHRIMILAPTGSAAALLNGSTYHSALGVKSDSRSNHNEHSTMEQVRSCLDGVDYIFIDEVSMISCYELYKISAQLAKGRNSNTALAECQKGGLEQDHIDRVTIPRLCIRFFSAMLQGGRSNDPGRYGVAADTATPCDFQISP
jgi:hypothetical protein